MNLFIYLFNRESLYPRIFVSKATAKVDTRKGFWTRETLYPGYFLLYATYVSLGAFIRWGFCPPGLLSAGAFVRRGFCPPGLLSAGAFIRRAFIRRGFYQWGYFRRGFCQWGFCQWGFCPRGFCPRGFFPRVFCPRGFCPRPILSNTFVWLDFLVIKKDLIVLRKTEFSKLMFKKLPYIYCFSLSLRYNNHNNRSFDSFHRYSDLFIRSYEWITKGRCYS